ncbi:hypothetical protein ADL22_05845 [Streptomyces sp. NRRL F-4489]|uniref:hypothetical protein n=1 Tax=Streptomyces sp. NRRL F-4489 TaxID=1609095 RepID=UPI0007469FCB|nr:hypothetical protein [Streptomyces sp. NRRL F-4489]KUL51736.1 hypothetical protein ADL22_05845 [Streptomyces sp. NRRL F-4489]
MTDPTRYSQRPIELPLDSWLYEARPAPGCRVCTALSAERDTALKAKDWRKAFEASREIRSHPSGHGKGRR